MPNREMIEFKVNGRAGRGFHVLPEGKPRAGMIVIQEYWGLNDHIKDIAARFAGLGYAALAPDLYQGTVARTADEASKLMQALDQGRALETLDGSVAYLQKQDGVSKIGVTGFCMGGSLALLLPCHNDAIKASAPFYGDVPPDDVLKKLSAPVLFIGASDDPWINKEKINRLRSGLEKFEKKGKVEVYQGVGHAFFNDTRPEAYNRTAAEDAWQKVTKFFQEELG